MSTDDGKKVAAEWHARMVELQEQKHLLRLFAEEIALGAYREHEAQRFARELLARVPR